MIPTQISSSNLIQSERVFLHGTATFSLLSVFDSRVFAGAKTYSGIGSESFFSS